MSKRAAIIIGAKPVGLTTAYELCKQTRTKPVVFKKSSVIGGLSRTVNYRGNRIDIGGLLFFPKSGRVMDWWLNSLPVEKGSSSVQGVPLSQPILDGEKNPVETDVVMLVRARLSRICDNYHEER
ncbi:MAG: NAD(P)-binding protein [candidate division KSB1 bacterium]|nr:NAD(P)-binding protein [candidate division KSB1 bacterium]